MKNQPKKPPIEQKKDIKKKERQLATEKTLSKSNKDIVKIIKLNTISPNASYKGEVIHVSTCGSKPVKSYVSRAVEVLKQKKEVMLFGLDKGLSKLVTTVQLVKQEINPLKQQSRICREQGKSKLEVILSV